MKDRQVWTRVKERIQTGTMPPVDPKPNDAERKLVADWIDQALANIDWSQVKNPGSVALPRLTRDEYANTVRDLFGVVVDVSPILSKDAEGPSGFVNDRASLQMTDRQLEAYFEAAQLVIDTTFEHHDPILMHYEAENSYKSTILYPTETTIEDVTGYVLRSGRGTKYQNIEQELEIPFSGTYTIRFRARTTKPERRGGIWVSIDRIDDFNRNTAILIEGNKFDIYETEIFLRAGHRRLMMGFDFDLVPWLPKVPDRPQRKLPTESNQQREIAQIVDLYRPRPVSWKELERAKKFQAPEGQKLADAKKAVRDLNEAIFNRLYKSYETARYHYEHNYLPVLSPPKARLGRVNHHVDKLKELTGVPEDAIWALWETHYSERFIESRRVHALHLRKWQAQQDDRDAHIDDVFLDWFEVEGPSAGAGDGRPAEALQSEGSPEEILKNLLPLAFRRPLRQAELARFIELYRFQRNLDGDAEAGLRRTLIAILVSPHFLYRSEAEPTTSDIVPLNDFQLASRLSYFLWSSMPDAELRSAAEAGELSSEQGIIEQLDRMLNDHRLRAFTRAFTEQWLDLPLGPGRVPDSELFREFSWHMATDMGLEVALNFERLLKENLSILELLDSVEGYVNERLARLYGMSGVNGTEFRLVQFQDGRRGGLLGTSAVLTATSLPIRTSPVLRGKFMIEKILGEKIPPPPDNVGDLPEGTGVTEDMTMREMLGAHRANPACAACHDRLDPMGFLLENYDIVGRWRTHDPGGPIDSGATLPDGSELGDVVDLKKYLLSQRGDDFTRSLTESMLAYALGRELAYYDVPAVDEIVDAVKSEGYRAQTLLRRIVTSYPFRFRNPGPVNDP